MAMKFFDAAADLVSLGFSIIPLRPNTKLPLIKAWQRLASSDLDPITHWSRQWPDANIGVATGDASGVAVIDLDVKDDRNGIETVAALAKAGKVLPPCPTVITPSGGRHLYFRMSAGLKNVVGVTGAGRGLGLGIDFRAKGGFVVAPPSILPNGAYRWLVPPMTPNFPRLPDWAVKLLAPPPPPTPTFVPDAKGGDIEPLARFVAVSPVGQRNDRLYWAACRARESRVSEAVAVHRLITAAEACGLKGPEVLRTIKSGLQGPVAHRRPS